MIRLIIVLVFLFLIWLLFVSEFSKNRKIAISVFALLLCGFSIWYDDYSKKAVEGLVDISNLQVCGVSGEHSYRTNFDINLCLQNTAGRGVVKRVRVAIMAARCNSADMCVVVDRVERARSLELAPGEQLDLKENLNFPNLDPDTPEIRWTAEVLSVKATQ